jgi:hypothetical protein
MFSVSVVLFLTVLYLIAGTPPSIFNYALFLSVEK